MQPVYDVKGLERVYKRNIKNMQRGKNVPSHDAALAVAAGHALDLISWAKLNKVKLDLTPDTTENIAAALLFLGTAEIQSGTKSKKDILEDLVKKGASYQMFELYEFLRKDPPIYISLELSDTVIKKMPELVLKAVKIETGETIILNVYEAYRRVQNTTFKFFGEPGAVADNAPIMRVEQKLAIDIILKEFLLPVMDMDVSVLDEKR